MPIVGHFLKLCFVKMNSPSFQSYNILGGNLNYPISNKCRRPAKSASILYTNRGNDAMVIFYCAIHCRKGEAKKGAIFFDLPNRHRVTN